MLKIEGRFAAPPATYRTVSVVRQGETEPTEVQVPERWSDNAAKTFASHYLRVVDGKRETSVRQAICRVSGTIARWAVLDGYIDDQDEVGFGSELYSLLESQAFTFNSPVWYNIGVFDRPQASACYIQAVDDSMDDLIRLQESETRLFKQGSGTGTNLSPLRPSGWLLSGGGSSSGPTSFMRGFDAWAGVTKSGGSSRRAAKMAILDVSHPDIMRFITEKATVERMAHDLVAAGWPADWNGVVGTYLPFQNANNSVRVTDDFMRAVQNDGSWTLSWNGVAAGTLPARDIWREIGAAAAACGCPGIQFHDACNRMHTSPSGGTQHATNPCCLIGDTWVQTVGGKIRIEDLSEMSERGEVLPHVCSYDVGADRWVTQRIKRAWKSGETRKLVEVTTTRGFSFRCTPEHLVLLESGGYEEAGQLWVGAPLRASPIRKDYVSSVDVIERKQGLVFEVFDLEGEDIHNFRITDGCDSVVVHNSEYSFIDDSACNLAHLRLQSFLLPDGSFDYDSYEAAVRIAIIAQDVIVDRASYPTEKIAENSRRYRPLGLGWAGGGALLMALGLPYDSDEGRELLAAITSCHAASAWIASSEIAAVKGRFDTDPRDIAATAAVLHAHALADEHDGRWGDRWSRALHLYDVHGVRNAQLTLLAPTGTCGMAMDADTNGCEPFFAPVTYKTLASGGSMKLAVEAAGAGLARLGYTPNQVGAILAHVAEHERFDDAPYLDAKHAAVFDCALPGKGGSRCISPRAHVDMMAALQPFLSGAISKTCNLPAGSTADEVLDLYMFAWQRDLKALAIYVDGCKFSQPIKTGGEKPGKKNQETNKAIRVQPVRERLPADRRAHNRHFNIGGVDGYITVGFYEDGRVGEVFTRLGKQNPTVASLFDAYMTALSIAFQYGVPMEVFLDKGEGMEFAPAGFTGDDLLSARSLVDYVCRYLRRFLPDAAEKLSPETEEALRRGIESAKSGVTYDLGSFAQFSGPACAAGTGCPGTMQTRGPCQQCDTCGHRQGCGG